MSSGQAESALDGPIERPPPADPAGARSLPVLETYKARLKERRVAHAREERASDQIGNVRLALALFTLVLVVLPLWIRNSGPWWALIPVALVFLVLGRAHDRVSTRARKLFASVRYLEREIDRIEERWRTFEDDGADLAPFAGATGWELAELDSRAPNTAYLATDLDLFGRASLFQLVSRAYTRHGRRVLARWLCGPADPDTVRLRQEGVKELAGAIDFREEMAVAVAGERALPLREDQLLAWAENVKPLRFGKALRILATTQPIALLLGAGAVGLGAPGSVLGLLILAHIATIFVTRGAVNERAEKLSTPDRALNRYADVIDVIESARLESRAFLSLREKLRTGGPSASERIRALRRMVDMLDARLNMFFALTFGPILLWDLNIVLRAERWQRETGKHLRGWIEVLGELEALASFGAFAYQRPDYTMPELVEGEGVFRAEGLAHPLIDRNRVVPNDLELGGPGTVLLLSGSNMSGKSTMLRAVGINVVLAQAGAPVAARRLVMSPTTLVTSIQVIDSLSAGTSHFYAELLRIKLVLDRAQEKRGQLLYLLDEMLHGTNSRERYIAAVSVIRWLSQKNAMGIVTTHDLGLAKVERELPQGRVRNMHFGDHVVGDKIQFDYRLGEGPVLSTNALRLMRAIGIDIELAAPED